VLLEFKTFELRRKDFQTLREGQWLNDEIINVYMALAQVGRRLALTGR
jgi:Ulp1 family protease